MMGPIERELRALTPWRPSGRFEFVDLTVLTEAAFAHVMQARDRLGIATLATRESRIPDVLSEAIEAAEALGL